MKFSDKITYRNGFRLNDISVSTVDIADIYEARRERAIELWEEYERQKSELREMDLSPHEYELACRRLADALGI